MEVETFLITLNGNLVKNTTTESVSEKFVLNEKNVNADSESEQIRSVVDHALIATFGSPFFLYFS